MTTRLLVLAVLLLPMRVLAADGQIIVQPTVNDTLAKEGCTAAAYPAGANAAEADKDTDAVADGDAHAGLTVAAGKYDVVTTCPTERGPIKQLTPAVAVKAGKPTNVPVKLENAALIVHGNNNGTRVKGDVAVFFAGTRLEVGKVATSNRLELSSGTYDIRIVGEVDGENCTVQVDKHALKAGRPQPLQVDMSNGMLKLLVKRNGKDAEGAGAVTFTGGANRIKEFASGEPVALAPGTYDVLGSLSSSFDFAEKRQRKVVITPGKVTEVAMDLPRGSVSTACELDGKEAPATIYGYLPGATEHFNTAPCGQVLELSPGKYHFKIVLDAEQAGYKILGGGSAPIIWHRNISVEKGKNKALAADFSPARIKVLARRNGELADAAVTLTLSGGPSAGGGPAWEELPLPPGRYDVEVMFPGKRGVSKELVRGIECQARKVCPVEVNLERAFLTVEVFKGGEPAPTAEIILYKGGSEVPYVKGASGEMLEVPPGEYVPEIRLGGTRKPLHKMRLRTGEPESKRVEVD